MPTQIGRRALPSVSFRTTTGILVAGSIRKPRIFTSCSMRASRLPHLLAEQTVRPGSRDHHLNIFSQKVLAGSSEIYDAISAGSAGPLAARGMAGVHEYLRRGADEALVAADLNLALAFLENGEPAALLFLVNCVRHIERKGVGARGILEGKDAVEFGLVEKRNRLLEAGGGLAGEADDHVRGDADGAPRGFDPGNFLEVLVARVGAAHGAKHVGGTGLHRQVNVLAKLRNGVNRLDDLAMEIVGMRGGEADAANAGNGRNRAQERDKIEARGRGIAVGIHRLPQQLNFGVAGFGEAARVRQHRGARAAAFRAAGARHNAIGAGVIASFDDREIRAKGIIAPRDFGFEGFVGIEIEARDTAAT